MRLRLEDDGTRDAMRGDNAVSDDAVLLIQIRSINHAPVFTLSNHSVFHSAENSGDVIFSPFAHVVSLGGDDELDQAYSFRVTSVASVDSMWPSQVRLAFLILSVDVSAIMASDGLKTWHVCRISLR